MSEEREEEARLAVASLSEEIDAARVTMATFVSTPSLTTNNWMYEAYQDLATYGRSVVRVGVNSSATGNTTNSGFAAGNARTIRNQYAYSRMSPLYNQLHTLTGITPTLTVPTERNTMINEHLEAIDDLHEQGLVTMKSLVKTRGGHLMRYLGFNPDEEHAYRNDYLQFIIEKVPRDNESARAIYKKGMIVDIYEHGHFSKDKDTSMLEADDDGEYDEDELNDAPYEKHVLDVVKIIDQTWVPRTGDVVKVNGIIVAFGTNQMNLAHEIHCVKDYEVILNSGPTTIYTGEAIDCGSDLVSFRMDSPISIGRNWTWCCDRSQVRLVRRGGV